MFYFFKERLFMSLITQLITIRKRWPDPNIQKCEISRKLRLQKPKHASKQTNETDRQADLQSCRSRGQISKQICKLVNQTRADKRNIRLDITL